MLIIVNLVVFVILTFIRVFFFFLYREDGHASALFEERILKWVVLPADPGDLAARPWTIFTYMFSHTGVLHILGNTLWLWAFWLYPAGPDRQQEDLSSFYLWRFDGRISLPAIL